jgi:hypothetical protein
MGSANPFNVTMRVRGQETVVRNIRLLNDRLQRAGENASWNGAQHLFARSRAVVPYQDGDLYNSAYMARISTDHFAMWIVGYDNISVDYAWLVHEIPNREHPTRGPSSEPKQDHFLSEPRDRMESTFPRTVMDEVQDAIRGARFERGR